MSISSFFVDNFSTIYYSSFTHTFPFFLGSILATIAGIGNTTTAFQQQVNTLSIKQAIGLFLGGLGVELLLLFTLQFSSIWTYLIGFLLSSLATVTMILRSGTSRENRRCQRTCNYPLLCKYFLWHLPLPLALAHYLYTIDKCLYRGIILCFSTILSTISFYILEPYIAGKVGSLFGLPMDLKPYKNGFLAPLLA